MYKDFISELSTEIVKNDEFKNKKTVLAIDDMDIILTLYNEFLTIEGYEVLTAMSGREGIEIYIKNADNIDLILLDKNLLDIDSSIVVEEILKRKISANIILCSGDLKENIDEKLIDKTKGFIGKPFCIHEFKSLVKEILPN